MLDELENCIGFQWDDGNKGKNWEKHGVSDYEAEEIFFNDPLVTGTDEVHSKNEPRYLALGQTNARRLLFVAFTIRKQHIRVISARDMTKREINRYQS